ncbi:hypothetical protein A7U43_11375 [Mycobacterium adipatum]|uniref:Uncharacterized protein n=1 Tax=Mycobacterium adipatum TaxID=1682113 RepID=A0A172ULU0_9MYCO|nr:hypothetical protein [Mycobacterium adipatum]ANE79840.1 hypothetical protein A7U43_11375 [Mycobacterium adipatum]MBI5738765.1 hypothetical protein [Mycolicibacterium neoaurum]
MRTAVVRIGVDPEGRLSAGQLRSGMAELTRLAAGIGARVIGNDLSVLPAARREAELLMDGPDAVALQEAALSLCTKAFGTEPVAGVVTFVSHGTDDDAHGVLAGFGLTGQVHRYPSGAGWDVVEVTLRRADLQRVPESRIHTALEASLNSEVRILVT